MGFIGLSTVWSISLLPFNSMRSPMKKFLLAVSITLAFLNGAFAQRMYDGIAVTRPVAWMVSVTTTDPVIRLDAQTGCVACKSSCIFISLCD